MLSFQVLVLLNLWRKSVQAEKKHHMAVQFNLFDWKTRVRARYFYEKKAEATHIEI